MKIRLTALFLMTNVAIVLTAQCPKLESVWPDESACSVAVKGNYAYVGDIWGDTIHIIDISNKSDPVKVGEFHIDGWHYDLKEWGEYLTLMYMDSNYKLALGILEIHDGAGLRFLSKCSIAEAYPSSFMIGSEIRGSLVYLSMGGLHIVDIQNPEKPKVLYSSYPSNLTGFIKIYDRYAYIGVWIDRLGGNGGYGGIDVYDVLDPGAPKYIDVLWLIATGTGGSLAPWTMEICGQYLYYSPGWDNGNDNWKGIGILNISKPDYPVEVGYSSALGPFTMQRVGTRLYSNSLSVADVSDCVNPFLIGEDVLFGRPYKLLDSGRYFFGASDGLGMFIFNVSDCQAHLRPLGKP